MRWAKKAGYWWDDWFILISILFVLVIDVLELYAVSYDPGGAEAAFSNGEIPYTPADVLYNKIEWAISVPYFTLTSTTKLSILFLFLRVFAVNRTLKHHVVAWIVIVTGFWVGSTVANILNCVPLKWAWLNSKADARYCFNFNLFWLASGIAEAVIDFAILVLPVPVIYRLRLDWSKKLAIVGVFCVGLFSVASGVAKIYLSYIPNSREISFNRTQLWTAVHICTGIICANVPVLWPLVVQLRDWSPSRLFRSTTLFSRIQLSWKSTGAGGSPWSSRKMDDSHTNIAYDEVDDTLEAGRSSDKPWELPMMKFDTHRASVATLERYLGKWS
ncbi:hypothetical protein F4808DRAFT_463381 [Astrocystis sublimbata]|nr:hypothetical protein F4808DRAFT_463381 [Astrocystis sublimbata]